MKKKKISLLIGVGILTVALVGGTLAWFTSKDNATNKFATGSIKHEILEKFKTKDKVHENILPGDEINKDVWIHSTGKSDSLLRVKVTPVWVDENNKETDASGQVELKFTNLEKIENGQKIGDWVKIGDYYYYNKVLKAHNGTDDNHIKHDNNGYITEDTGVPSSLTDCHTSQLLDSITFNSGLSQTEGTTQGYENKRLDVKVESETVQTTNNAYKSVWNVNEGTDEGKAINELIASIIANYSNGNN